MILKVGAWYYIITGALGILGAVGSRPGVAGLLMSGLFIAVGVGLLKKQDWGRFAALGLSLLGWTLGGLLLLGSIIWLVAVGGAGALLGLLFAGGMYSLLIVIVALAVLVWIVGIVISYRLFWYLCSEEGCAEFGVPHGSTQAVLISTGAWLAFSLLNAMWTGSGGMWRQLSSGTLASREDDAQRRALERERQQEARRMMKQARAEAEKRAAQEEEIQAQLDALQAQESGDEAEVPEDLAQAPAEEQAPVGEVPVAEASPAPEATPEPAAAASTVETTEDQPQPSSRKILKCKETSGGITFTQGYCPPGSKQVEM